MAFVALVAFSALHSSNGNSGWTRLDDEASSLLSVQASNSHILNKVNDSVVCQVVLFEDVVVFDVKEGDTVGQVRTRLATACQDPKWGYSASLCNELMSELFKGDDADTLLDELQCPQVDGLVREHWQHQFASKSLQQRSQPPRDVTLMQNPDSGLEEVCYTKESNCYIPNGFKNQNEFYRAWYTSYNQACRNQWKRDQSRVNFEAYLYKGGRLECVTAQECFYNLFGFGGLTVGEDYDRCCEHLDNGQQEVCDERQWCPYATTTTTSTPGPIMVMGDRGWKKHYWSAASGKHVWTPTFR